MFINIVFWLGWDRPSGLLSFVFALLFSILTSLFLPSSSVSLSYFILAVPIRECLGKHLCMSSSFPIALLNDTFFFSRNDMIEMVEVRLSKTSNNINNNNMWNFTISTVFFVVNFILVCLLAAHQCYIPVKCYGSPRWPFLLAITSLHPSHYPNMSTESLLTHPSTREAINEPIWIRTRWPAPQNCKSLLGIRQ